MRYRVEFDRQNCIGAGACIAASPDFWSLDQDGKATLKEAEYDAERKIWVLWVDEKDVQKHLDASKTCPVSVIHVYDEEGNLVA